MLDNEIISLMKELDIQHCCLSIMVCQEGPGGRDILDRELMIAVNHEGGASSFLAVQEFTWGDKIDKVKRLQELVVGS